MDRSAVLRFIPAPVALALLIGASALPYLFDLGFYSDDWDFLQVQTENADLGFTGRYAALDENPNLHARPVQIAHMLLLFEAFGLDPLGYHVVNTATLAAAAVLMHLVLRRLGISTGASFAAALLFTLSPTYSTNRFWFASFGYVLMMALYFLSLHADLRALSGTRGIDWRWKGVALAALILCALGYEIAIPLLVGNLLLLALRVYRPSVERSRRLRRWEAGAFLASSIVALAVVVHFKVATSVGAGLWGGVFDHVVRLGWDAGLVQFGTYGLALPTTTWWAAQEADAPAIVLALAVGVGACSYLHAVSGAAAAAPSRAERLRLLAYGTTAVFLGYAIFLVTPRFSAASTGVNNRINIGGALGVSLLVVAAAAVVAGLSRSPSLRRKLYSSFLGLLSFSFALTIGAVSTYWVDAYRDQRAVLARMEAVLPSLASGATVILTGHCPYRGPAVVFESGWDLSGALSIRRGGGRILANVVTPRLEVEQAALSATIYSGDDGRYPFGADLYLYDDRDGSVHVLRDLRSAEQHLGKPGAELGTACPVGAEGWGVPVVPLERFLANRGLFASEGGPA